MQQDMVWLPLEGSAQGQTEQEHPYSSFIHKVEKPARYMGGEFNSDVKDWTQVDARMALCFPDVYDIGMSHLGTKILYNIVNKTDDLCLERAFCPWPDMETELRQRSLPILSLENHQPLSAFDIVGFSLQYEMTFTNVLTMLELGNIPLHNEDRTLEHPLVIAGGPVATQPEPMSPYIDVFLIGDAEERLPRLMRHYMELKGQGLSRQEILIELAKEGGLYCPDLYAREICSTSNLMVVGEPVHDDVPDFVERALLGDISRYRFPDDSPVAVAEAIFDRMSIEIARGCTEGCRFCQAGMIYRPVRERDPEEVVDTLISALDKGGYDEASITCLSTADYSCVSPLIKTLMGKLRERKTSLGISSLRAYGLNEDLLDEIDTVKATGLTFAPEAGTQRMRDVINKNVTEDDIYATCHRVLSRGWNKLKLYFMIGLPTEEDEDVIGIAKMGKQALEIGQLYKNKVKVTVSVSSHVPKPHTPFQWCRMDRMEEIEEKQEMLWKLSKKWGYRFRKHDLRISHLEGIMARGDRRVSKLVEKAWRKGVRFDGWDEHLNWDVWQEALVEWEEEEGISRTLFMDTIPVDGRLPWDHLDVGLAENFLIKEYRKAMKNRLSPPCGKPKEAKIHHTNVKEHEEDERKLVCYHCGVACDLSNMKDERLNFLKKLDAWEPAKAEERVNAHERAMARYKQGKTPHNFNQGQPVRYRLKFTKLSPMNQQSHHDLLRVMPRIMRRAKLPLYYSQGFNPKPVMTFGPALSLGIQSLAEYMDIALTEEWSAHDVLTALREAAPTGLQYLGVRQLGLQDTKLSKRIQGLDYLIVIPEAEEEALYDWLGEHAEGEDVLTRLQTRCAQLMEQETIEVTVFRKKKERTLNLRPILGSLEALRTDDTFGIAGVLPGRLALRYRSVHSNGPSVRPLEVVEEITGLTLDYHNILREMCWHINEEGEECDPLEAVELPDLGIVKARQEREEAAEMAASEASEATPTPATEPSEANTAPQEG